MKTTTAQSNFAFLIILLAFLTGFKVCNAQVTQMEDVVYLKNGGIIRGIIIEQVPGQTLKIQTRDGNVFVYSIDEIARFTKEISKQPEQQKQNISYSQKPKEKNAGTAFFLSFIIPGAGQFYNGENGKGFLMLGTSIIGIAMISSANQGEPNQSEDDENNARVGAFIYLLNWVVSMIDAPVSSNRINQENSIASIFHPTENMDIGITMQRVGLRTLPCVRGVLSF